MIVSNIGCLWLLPGPFPASSNGIFPHTRMANMKNVAMPMICYVQTSHNIFNVERYACRVDIESEIVVVLKIPIN